MMNQMLSGCSNSRAVSKERLDEIFAVPKTATLWQQIVEHEKYKEWFYRLNRQIKDETIFIPDWDIEKSELIYEEKMKYTIIDKAMVICAQQGCSFNEAVQEAEKRVLSEFENVILEEEELEEYYEANIKKAPRSKLLTFLEFD